MPVIPSTPQMTRSVSAILLAAGASSRFSHGNKLLADLDGQPLISWTAEGLRSAGVAEIIVVTGPRREEVERALRGAFDVGRGPHLVFAHNPDHSAGMGTSIAVGIATVSASLSGALVCPGDMPGITRDLVDRLIRTWQSCAQRCIVCPETPDGRQGNPVLWPRRFFDRLARLSGPQGGKALLNELSDDVVTVFAEGTGAAIDIDTVEDLARYKQQRSGQEPD